jgi:O-antigen/teichoic acid export membrane protein
LGLQGASLRISLFSSLISVLLTYVLAAQPALRLYGALAALAASLLITLVLSLKTLKQTISLHEGYTAR